MARQKASTEITVSPAPVTSYTDRARAGTTFPSLALFV
jgi:hypothetical protein